MMHLNELTGAVVDSAMKVHSALGPGLLESAYEACLAHELKKRDLRVVQQAPLPLIYDEVRLDIGYRIDLIVSESIIVELKTVPKILPVHEAQIISYLKLSAHKVGLLINFHVVHLKDGISRFVNKL